MYTKESAMTLGIALTFLVIIKMWQADGKIITKVSIQYAIGQMFLLGIYLVSRYMKLGSLFSVQGGFDAGNNIDIISCLKKIVGYFLLSWNIPNTICFELYMCPQLQGASVVISQS